MRILAINPGATSTKVAVFDDETEVWRVSLAHTGADLAPFHAVMEQLDYRLALIEKALADASIEMGSIDAICGRGGLMKPLVSGTYRISESTIEDLTNCTYGEHAANLGCCLAWALEKKYGIPSYFVDAPSTDERLDIARISGFKGMERSGIFHVLNQKSMARAAAEELSKPYEECSLIVVHMGGGTSVAAHKNGRVIDFYDCQSEGTFSIDRCGSLPVKGVIPLCFHTGMSESELRKAVLRDGGLYSYLGTRDFLEVEARVKAGDEEATLIARAMAYQTAKDIGSMAAVLCYDVDAIVLTGGLAYSEWLCGEICRYIDKIAPILLLPGENEMQSMANGVLRVYRGTPALIY